MLVTSKVLELDPKAVKVGWRARKDYGDITELAKSIKSIGQLHPIVVRKNKAGDHIIIAGMRRLRACKQLKRKVLATVVQPKDEITALEMQLEENVKRKGFDQLEVAEGLKRFKAVYEKKYPATVKGATLKRGDKPSRIADLAKREQRYTQRASDTLGISERSVYELLEVANLPSDYKKKIDTADTTSARNKVAREAVSAVRRQKKERKLEQRAAQKAKARKTTKEERKAPPIHLHQKDNKKIFPEIGKAAIDLVLTDPPYELTRSAVSHTTRTSLGKPVAWDKLNVGWVMDVAPLIAKGGQLIAFCPLEAIGEYRAVCKAARLTYRGAIIWHKTNPGTVHRATYLSSVEAFVWATKGDEYYFKPWKNAGAREVHNCIEGPICGGNERMDHPTQKPLWLMDTLLERHAQKGDLVLDPFAGVGSTLVACKQRRLAAVGIEIEAKYVKQAALRLKAV